MKKIIGGIIFAAILCPCTESIGNLKKEAEAFVSGKTKEQLNTMNEYCRMKGKEFDMKKEEAQLKKEQVKAKMIQNKVSVWRELAVKTIPDFSQTLIKFTIPSLACLLGLYMFKDNLFGGYTVRASKE